MKVFIVEDSPLVQERLARLIGGIANLDVAGVADTVTSAIEGVAQCRPQAVTLDLRLKDGNGINALRAMKQMEFNPVVIVLTVNDSPRHKSRCLLEGADYFFSKATEFAAILETLAHLAKEPQSNSKKGVFGANAAANPISNEDCNHV